MKGFWSMNDKEKQEILEYLDDVLEQVALINKKIKKTSQSKFMNDEMINSSIIRNLITIGEALKNIPNELINSDEFEDLQQAKKMRDILIHDYRNIQIKIVYDTCKNDIPNIKKKVLKLKEELE